MSEKTNSIEDWLNVTSLPETWTDYLSAQERVIVAITGKNERAMISRTLAEHVGAIVMPPWTVESLHPFPILSCLVNAFSESALQSLRSALHDSSCRLIVTAGAVVFGISGTGRDKAYGSSGSPVSRALAAVLNLPFHSSWADEYVCSRCLLKPEHGMRIFDSLFYQI